MQGSQFRRNFAHSITLIAADGLATTMVAQTMDRVPHEQF